MISFRHNPGFLLILVSATTYAQDPRARYEPIEHEVSGVEFREWFRPIRIVTDPITDGGVEVSIWPKPFGTNPPIGEETFPPISTFGWVTAHGGDGENVQHPTPRDASGNDEGTVPGVGQWARGPFMIDDPISDPIPPPTHGEMTGGFGSWEPRHAPTVLDTEIELDSDVKIDPEGRSQE